MATNTPNYNLELPGENDFYNINVVNENNTKIDTALKENKDSIDSHNEGSIISETGNHGMRYHEEKLQAFVDGEWKDISTGGSGNILVEISVDTGAEITATSGESIVQATSTNSKAIIKIPHYGTWTFTGTLGEKSLDPVKLEINETKVYYLKLSFFKKKLTVKTNLDEIVNMLPLPELQVDKKIIVTNTDTNESQEFQKGKGEAEITISFPGNYSLVAMSNDGTLSQSTTVEVSNESDQSITLLYVGFIVTCDVENAIVTAEKGNIIKNNYYEFAEHGSTYFMLLPETGTWKITMVSEGVSNSTLVDVAQGSLWESLHFGMMQFDFKYATLNIRTNLDDVRGINKSITIINTLTDEEIIIPKDQESVKVKVALPSIYAIYATMLNGTCSIIQTVNVTSDKKEHDILLKYMFVMVGSNKTKTTFTASKDGVSITPFQNYGNGATFLLPELGEWTFTAVSNGETESVISKIDEMSLATMVSITILFHDIYGVEINLNVSNPETAVTYTDKAVGMTAGSTDWDSTQLFQNIVPVKLGKTTEDEVELHKNDFTMPWEGGTLSVNTDVDNFMVRFPKMGYKISKTSDNIVKVQMTTHPNKEGFCYAPFSKDSEGDCNYLYIGMYLSTIKAPINGIPMRLASLPSSFALKASTLDEFENRYTYASNNGDGWYTMGYYQTVLLQCLYLLRYKNLNAQGTLGLGRVQGGSHGQNSSDGHNVSMYNGQVGGNYYIRFAGIENFYGNLRCIVDGIIIKSNADVCTCKLPKNFNTAGENYNLIASGVLSKSGYLKNVRGTNDLPFFPENDGFSGSNSTYFCDNVTSSSGMMASFGGDADDDTMAGAFSLQFDVSSNDKTEYKGFRLMKLVK